MAIKTKSELFSALSANRARLRQYGVKRCGVFGSFVREKQTEQSDVDILVEFFPGSAIGWDFFNLEEELSQVIGRKVDLGTKQSLKPWVRQQALRDARLIYTADAP